MYRLTHKKYFQKGETYLSIIIAVGVLIILTHAMLTLVLSTYEIISFTRSRVTAMHIAEQKLEYLRNLAYANLGTVGGIPAGLIPQTETVNANGNSYTVSTDIVYVDDPFDNLAPTDTLPTDYKRTRVEVSWDGLGASKSNPIVLITDISPKGIETTAGGGTLSIQVFDSQAQPVSGATVTIVNNTVTPHINLSLNTDANGSVMLPGAPACNACYRISISKSGYSSDRTYSLGEIANPNKPDQGVIQGRLTSISFSIDKVSTLVVKTVGTRLSGFTSIPSVSFKLSGKKTLGTDSADTPVYKYSANFATDVNGQVSIPNLEWDNYDITPIAPSSFDISGANPLLPFALQANQTLTALVSLSGHTSNSLLVGFTDTAGVPLASITAKLTKTPSYSNEKISGNTIDPDWGQVFYDALSATTYHLQATSTAFITNDVDIQVNGTTKQTIVLNPQP